MFHFQIDMLQHNVDALASEVKNEELKVSDDLLNEVGHNFFLHTPKTHESSSLPAQITAIGFAPEVVQVALEQAFNNSERAIEILLKMQTDGTYDEILESLLANMPSTSAGASSRQEEAVRNLKKSSEKFKQTMEVC